MTKQSNLPLLLSAFAFPGAGHLYLKKYLTGILLTGTAVLALYFIISKMLERAQQIADKILLGEVPLDISAISELVTRQSMAAGDESMNYAWAALVIAWLVGIGDTYRIARLKSKADTAES